jgi:hypothetical protein
VLGPAVCQAVGSLPINRRNGRCPLLVDTQARTGRAVTKIYRAGSAGALWDHLARRVLGGGLVADTAAGSNKTLQCMAAVSHVGSSGRASSGCVSHRRRR